MNNPYLLDILFELKKKVILLEFHYQAKNTIDPLYLSEILRLIEGVVTEKDRKSVIKCVNHE